MNDQVEAFADRLAGDDWAQTKAYDEWEKVIELVEKLDVFPQRKTGEWDVMRAGPVIYDELRRAGYFES